MQVLPENKDAISVNLLPGGACFSHHGVIYMVLSHNVHLYAKDASVQGYKLDKMNAIDLESGKLQWIPGDTVVKALPEATVRY